MFNMVKRFSGIFLLIGFLFLLISQVEAVPVAPNESLVTAKVLEVKLVDSETLNMTPQQTIGVLRLLIKEAKDVPGVGNRLKDKVGKEIVVYCKAKECKKGDCKATCKTGGKATCKTTKGNVICPCMAESINGKIIQARIHLSGDERGRKYWIKQICQVKEKCKGKCSVNDNRESCKGECKEKCPASCK